MKNFIEMIKSIFEYRRVKKRMEANARNGNSSKVDYEMERRQLRGR